MKRFFFLAASICILAACSGLEQPGIDERIPSEDLVQKVILEVLPIKDGGDVETKASAVPNGNNVNFAWEATDTVGIFPDLGSQVYFLIDESSVGKSSASFDGGAWALKQNSTYVSYYPLVGEFYLQRDKIPVSFAGQKQIGTSAPFNGARYFLATGPTTSENGVLRFSYNTLNTIFNINATLPAGTYTKAMMTLNEPLFVEDGIYSLDDPQIVGKKYTNNLTIDLEDVTLTSRGVLPIYLMAAPVDLRGKEVTIKVISSDGKKFECVKTLSKNYEAGTRYGLTCNEMTQSNAGNIVFADPNIKAALVAAFDTEGDGELSYLEAAAVSSIQGVFGTKKTYTSFDEFQFFTGVTNIPAYMFEGWQIASIVLPESVSFIGSYAFRDCVKLTSVSIPNSVNHLFRNVFAGCSRLSSITIPESVTSIDAWAFSDCSSLISISIPESVTSFETGVFYGCSSLASITLPESTTSIGEQIFSGCSSLTSISIPESVTTIRSRAFTNCSSLTSITIPESVTSIGFSAFSGCSSLTSISIPKDVYKIEDETFYGCNSLTSIIIPEAVINIGNKAFSGCSNLTSITIPKAVTSIGNNAFYGCSNLTSINIPESVMSIGSSAFYDCSSLTSITIPESVASIGTYAFGNCFSLESITIPEAVTIIEDGTFRGCTSLATVTLPEAVTKIGGQAFWECGNLLSVTIPSSVTSIGDRAFFSCSKLESIICLANTPPSGVNSSTFYRAYGCRIYVPAGSVSTYKAADGWSNYADRIYSMEGGDVPPSGDGGDE